MSTRGNNILLLAFLFAVLNVASSRAVTLGEGTDLQIDTFGKYKPEFFWGDNISLFNDNNVTANGTPLDRITYLRQTVDLGFNAKYGMLTWERPVAETRIALRSKNLWGNPNIFKVSDTQIKLGDALVGSHNHFVPRILFWMRESWLRFPLGHPVGLDFKNRADLTLGIFAFSLGRGISLGDSFAAGQDSVGFYSDSLVDQYAPGALLSGDFISDVLSYNLYFGFLQNNSGSLGDTAAKVRNQEYGYRDCPARGFGRIHYVIAGNVQWTVFDNKEIGSLMLEPYALFNEDPEQKVEFTGDASAKLGTIGLATEYAGERWEFGFDGAVNLGYQKVKGWDRNTIEITNRNGNVTYVNSHVLLNADPNDPTLAKDLKNYKAVQASTVVSSTDHSLSSLGKKSQDLINKASQGSQYNGLPLGQVSGFTVDVDAPSPTADPSDILYNAKDRFRDPYTNSFQGWMIVGDASWWVYGKDLKVAITGGVASGDKNPNEELKDGNYQGFVGIQEAYSGKRVPSAFLLGSAGKARRPLSQPTEESGNDFASEVSNFTDLVLCGTGFTWTPKNWTKKFSWNSNVLAYWEQFPINKFDAQTQADTNQKASTFLGTEINAFLDYYLLKTLRLFSVVSVFVPGSHYSDIRGKPLTKDQQKALEKLNTSGFDDAKVPNLGDDVAVTFNVGLEYKF